MRYLLALILGLTVAFIPVPPTSAAPVAQECPVPGSYGFPQADMAGVYVSPQHMMRVEVYPCGGSIIVWDNQFGRHTSVYASVGRLPGGGIAMRGTMPDPMSGGYLDNAYTTGVKPAEAGFIQVITISPYGDAIRVYRLQKL